MLFQGPLGELQQMKTRQTSIEIQTNDNVRATSLLNEHVKADQQPTRIIIPFESNEKTAKITRLLVEGGLDVYAIHPQQNDLEQLFLDITSAN